MKGFVITLLALLLASLSFGLGFAVASHQGATRMDRVVAISWGDGKYGQAFYGARVYLEPQGGGYSVRAVVQIGRGNPYFHEAVELGRAETEGEAVRSFGRIEFRPDGLHIGSYFMPRQALERHR